MKRIALLSSCLITWLVPLQLGAQPVASTAADTSTALSASEILQQAIKAAGGATWQQPKTLQLKGDAVWTPYGKTDTASKLTFDDYTLLRVFPSESQAAHQANGKVRIEAKHGNTIFLQLIFDSKVTRNTLSDAAKPYQKHFSWSNNFGFGILRFADRDGFALERLADDQVEGNNCYVVQITDPKKTLTTFFIDQQNKVIRSVAFATDVGFHHRIYSDFKRAPNVDFVQPTRMRLYFDGIKWMDIHWRQFKVNETIADTAFEK